MNPRKGRESLDENTHPPDSRDHTEPNVERTTTSLFVGQFPYSFSKFLLNTYNVTGTKKAKICAPIEPKQHSELR
jgi:hypothetical protein